VVSNIVDYMIDVPYRLQLTFTVHRDPEDEDVNNNKYTSTTATKNAFQNSWNKVPVNKFSEEAPVYRWVFLLGFCNEIV
jgi:hypothetical protein